MSKLINAEIKARCHDSSKLHRKLLELGADFKGEDKQIDRYFNVPEGRLKLRSGNIENSLIFYNRADDAEIRESSIYLEKLSPNNSLDKLLGAALGTKIVVAKTRRIYFIENVKFHLDTVEGLGEFVEIEAIAKEGEASISELQGQCSRYVAQQASSATV